MSLRLTRDQARALGLRSPPARERPADGMNGLERSFRDRLDAALHRRAISVYWREGIKLRLAGRTWYTPDFAVYTWADGFTLVEVKGYMREDAAVKIKVAATLFPYWKFLLVYRQDRTGWRVYEVTERGIGTHPIGVPWIHGA
jgi:hypothetical protein